MIRQRVLLAALAVVAFAAFGVAMLPLAGSAQTADGPVLYGCVRTGGSGTERQEMYLITRDAPPSCPAGSYLVSWQGLPPVSPSPTPTPPSPSPTPTTPSPAPTGAACVTSSPSGNCGPYTYPAITNSNGYDTYVANNCWADPSCQQTVTAYGPGDWSVVAHEPAGSTAVATYPDVQQLMNNYSADGTWSGSSYTPLAGVSQLTSTYAENMHETPGTIAQAAYDIWLSGTTGPDEVMIWVDNSNRGTGGATVKGTAVIGGQTFTVMEYGSGELIFSLDHNQQAGTVDIRATLQWAVGNGYESPGLAVTQIQFGWEICSTGGAAETFTVSGYSITAAA